MIKTVTSDPGHLLIWSSVRGNQCDTILRVKKTETNPPPNYVSDVWTTTTSTAALSLTHFKGSVCKMYLWLVLGIGTRRNDRIRPRCQLGERPYAVSFYRLVRTAPLKRIEQHKLVVKQHFVQIIHRSLRSFFWFTVATCCQMLNLALTI